jgi:hypothetical protein
MWAEAAARSRLEDVSVVVVRRRRLAENERAAIEDARADDARPALEPNLRRAADKTPS